MNFIKILRTFLRLRIYKDEIKVKDLNLTLVTELNTSVPSDIPGVKYNRRELFDMKKTILYQNITKWSLQRPPASVSYIQPRKRES